MVNRAFERRCLCFGVRRTIAAKGVSEYGEPAKFSSSEMDRLRLWGLDVGGILIRRVADEAAAVFAATSSPRDNILCFP